VNGDLNGTWSAHLDAQRKNERFKRADLPQIEGATGRFMLQQMVAVAELEAGMISKRTNDALAAAKRRGVKLGGDRGARLTAKARRRGNEAMERGGDQRAPT
jgi:DNA invertase Pin-like site-specific DNA recombinase